MNNRIWLCLLLGVLLAFLPERELAAQQPKPSHYRLNEEMDANEARARMAERFRELRELHQLQEQMRGLLQDPKFLDKLKGQFSDERLRQLGERFQGRGDTSADSVLNKSLQRALENGKLNPQQFNVLNRYLKHSTGNRPANVQPPTAALGQPNRPTPPSLPPSLPPSAAKLPPLRKSLWDDLEEKSEKLLSDYVQDANGDIARALSEMENGGESDPLAELLRTLRQADLPIDNLAESAEELSRHLPNVSGFLDEYGGVWEEIASLYHSAPVSALSDLGSGRAASALSSAGAANGEWGAVPFTLLTFGMFVLLTWQMGGWSKGRKDDGEGEAWREAWPVAPDAVATRRDLVRAFEHLVLLRLGRAARSRNHRRLAESLIEQDRGDGKRRQCVELLAWMYEQARYAPAEDSLPQQELSDARHALSYLAGVTAV